MAFLANLKSSVPIVNEEDVVDTDDEVELASLNQVRHRPPTIIRVFNWKLRTKPMFVIQFLIPLDKLS